MMKSRHNRATRPAWTTPLAHGNLWPLVGDLWPNQKGTWRTLAGHEHSTKNIAKTRHQD